jgi:hypothetical protein
LDVTIPPVSLPLLAIAPVIFIGVGRRGQQLLESLPGGAKVVAVCDVFRPRAETVGGKYHAKVFTDFRQLVEKKNVDAVVIATPLPHRLVRITNPLPLLVAPSASLDLLTIRPVV